MGDRLGGGGVALAAVSDAVLGIAGDLSLDAVLQRLVHAARHLVDARYAALGVPDDEGTGFARFITAGMTDEQIEAIGPLPRTHGLLGAMLADLTPYRTDDITTDPRYSWWPHAHPAMRSFLGVPIVFKGDVIGAFYLTDKEGERAFDEADEELVGVLAAHAAVLIDHAHLYERSRELSIIGERDRLARELHDAMAQTLFSLRLRLQTAAALVRNDPGRAESEMARAEELVSSALAELRTLVFELRPPSLDADGLVASVRKHVEVLGRAYGLEVVLEARGEDRLPAAVEPALFRIIQEALTNVVRHASAQSVTVSIEAGPATASVVVRDDGVGFDPSARAISGRRLGLTSMRERAQALGGVLGVESTPGAGATVRAEVPLG